MRRRTYRAQDKSPGPEEVDLDTDRLGLFHNRIESGDPVALKYIKTRKQQTPRFVYGVVEDITRKDGADRVTVKSLARTGEFEGEKHYTFYLDVDGDYQDPLALHARDPSHDKLRTIGGTFAEPSERFFANELPTAEKIGFIISVGILDEYNLYDVDSTEEFWVVPDRVRTFSTYEDSKSLSLGILNRTGEEHAIEFVVDFAEWIEWKHDGETGIGQFTKSGLLEDNRQRPIEIAIRNTEIFEDPPNATTVTATLALGSMSETFDFEIYPAIG